MNYNNCTPTAVRNRKRKIRIQTPLKINSPTNITFMNMSLTQCTFN
uniref:Uncharacterized protein n=1 Tax=Anguilla anguilla TaxID=7936 RepID=A0A0E9RK25_ANGAN